MGNQVDEFLQGQLAESELVQRFQPLPHQDKIIDVCTECGQERIPAPFTGTPHCHCGQSVEEAVAEAMATEQLGPMAAMSLLVKELRETRAELAACRADIERLGWNR